MEQHEPRPVAVANHPAQKQQPDRLVSASHPGTSSAIALALSPVLFAAAASVQAQTTSSDGNTTETALERVRVEESVSPDTNPYAEPGAPYVSNSSADPRRTRPLSETPQTFQVLTGTQIEESGRSDLREILDGQPGITLGTGENGNAFGDRYIIRGHEARSDMFVDGLRDPGMTIRESFAVEQVEISKGPSSTFAGRGTTGGAVNSVTKLPSNEYDFGRASLGIGTDSHFRGTIDYNRALSADTAVRANILFAGEDVPDRSPADRQRRGIALSGSHFATDKLKLTADIYHLTARDKPDLGTYIPNLGNGVFGSPVADIPVYLQGADFLNSSVNTLTFRAEYELNPRTQIINLTRYGTIDNGYVVTGARGGTGYPSEADATAGTNGYPSIGLSTHQGWQDVQYFGNQLSAILKRQIGGMNHDIVFGFTYTDQRVVNGVYQVDNLGAQNCWAVGRGGTAAQNYCIIDSNGNLVPDVGNLLGRSITQGESDSDWRVKTVSLSAMDSVDLNDRWTMFSGLRYDYYDYSNLANYDPDGRTGPEPSAPFEFADKSGLLNGHLCVTYRFVPNARVYASASTATNINGGESDLGTSCGYGGVCVADGDTRLGDPERSINYELGIKWQPSRKLHMSAALFQITKRDVMESPSGDSYSTLGSLNTGENRVRGIELGMVGKLTPRLSIAAGLTLMDAEVTRSINPDNVGKTLANFADKSASVQLKYRMNRKFAFGGTATFEGARYTGQPDAAANEAMEVPSYGLLDLFATYNFSRDLSLRLNVNNVADKDYYLAAYRSGGFTYIGDGRSAQLTLQYRF